VTADVHVSVDDVVIMSHDPCKLCCLNLCGGLIEHLAALDRTTNGKGLIREQCWYGENGMERLRTVKQPQQSLCTFAETVELLMKVCSVLPIDMCTFV
jgi:phosphatidylglycerol phospholipase C